MNFFFQRYYAVVIILTPPAKTLQTHHVDSMLKRRGNDRFLIVSTWNPRGVFAGKLQMVSLLYITLLQFVINCE